MTQTDSLSRKIADDLWKQASVWDLDVPEDRMELGRVISSELAEREQKVEEQLVIARRLLGGALRNGDWGRVKEALSAVRAALSGLGVTE